MNKNLSPGMIATLAASFASDRKTATTNLAALALHCAVHDIRCRPIQRQIDKYAEMLAFAASFGETVAEDAVATI